jgi:hypothetical protein
MALSTPQPGKRGEHVLDGVNLQAAFAERGRARGIDDLLDAGFQFGLALEINAAKAKCRNFRARAETSC